MFSDAKPVKSKKKEQVPFIDEFLDWLKTICKTLILVILTFTFIARTARVEGHSMEPTLIERDFLILRSFCYTPRQGDIVAANCDGLGKVIVKRIIAVGGQEVFIDFEEGKVYVDGELFEVDGLANITTDRESNYSYPIQVPDGKYFVMGDNRQESTDSRSRLVGLIDRDDILGKAIMRVYPFNKIGGLYRKR